MRKTLKYLVKLKRTKPVTYHLSNATTKLGRLVGIFPIYKPPHQSLQQVKHAIEQTLLKNLDVSELPETSLLHVDGAELVKRVDLRLDSKVESDSDRLARLGLGVSLFPPISPKSSGVTFCSIGQAHPLLAEFIAESTKFGAQWQFSAQMGISTGADILVHPNDLTDDEIELIKEENLFTVEGLVTGRQRLDEVLAQKRHDKSGLLKKLKKVTHSTYKNARTHLIQTSLKLNGLRHIWDVAFDPDQHWVRDLGALDDIHVVDFGDQAELVKMDEGRQRLHFGNVLLTGHPEHHYFGVLANYITHKSSRINSSLISSRRVGFGTGVFINNDHLYMGRVRVCPVLTHYEYRSLDSIVASIDHVNIKFPRIVRLIENEKSKSFEQFKASVEREMTKVSVARAETAEVDAIANAEYERRLCDINH